MNKMLKADKETENSIFKTYYPERRKLKTMDELSLTVFKRIQEKHPNLSYETIRKSLLQIVKEEHYQLMYYDGHLPEITVKLYQLICETVAGKLKESELDMFLCDLMYWCKEIKASSLSNIEKNLL